jgi:hypothetical protein
MGVQAMSWEGFWENLAYILGATFIFGGWVIYAGINAVAKNWRKARESEHLTLLKQSMIERGMSAEDIERVLKAGMPAKDEADPKSA